jgi:hypothetical protein
MGRGRGLIDLIPLASRRPEIERHTGELMCVWKRVQRGPTHAFIVVASQAGWPTRSKSPLKGSSSQHSPFFLSMRRRLSDHILLAVCKILIVSDS